MCVIADVTPSKIDQEIDFDAHHRSDGEEIQEPLNRIARSRTPKKLHR